MASVDWKVAKSDFAKFGLNIFLSVELKKLTSEIYQIIKNEVPEIELYQSLVLIGNGGKDFWEQLTLPLDESQNPIDQFSLDKLSELSEFKDFKILYPSKIYFPPLQKFSRLFGFSYPSPMGLDISNQFGSWFAFRLCFLTKSVVEESALVSQLSPCENCLFKPCLTNCPASATHEMGIDLKGCANYRLGEASNCADRCLARLSCPVQKQHQYSIEQIQYHMLRVEHLKKLAAFK